MSFKINGARPTRNTAGLSSRNVGGSTPPVSVVTTPWVRDPSWPACEAASGSNKIVGLYAVWPGDGVGNGGNFFAMTISGAYTINYGDDTTTNYTTGSTAYYEFNFNNAALNGTNAPVTFTASTDTVNRTAHGYSNGMTVRFYGIVTTTGLVQNTPYFVINATADSFQVSATSGGAAIDLVNDGSAALLPYKIATVTITPQVASDLTGVNFFVKHNQAGLADGYSTGWLDIAVAGASISTLTISSSLTTIRHATLERVRLNQLGNVTSMFSLFNSIRSLRDVVIADSPAVTDMSSMFLICSSLTNVTLFDTATASVTNMQSMFQSCVSLTTVPLFNTAAATNMIQMFQNCLSLKSVPLFNTASVTNMSNMFNTCRSLTTVSLFNTASVTNMTGMFQNCNSLTSVPLFNTAAVTDMLNMFNACRTLTSVPLFNTASVTNMASMFLSCNSLAIVPLFNTAAATNMSNMFQLCYSLTSVPLFNTASVTSMSSIFDNCILLTSVPFFNTASVTNMTNMFGICSSLASVPLFNTASVTNMSFMFQSCGSLTTVPLFNTASVTNMANMFSGCSSLTTVPLFNTVSVTDMSFMFNSCPSLTTIPLFNVVAVTNMGGMFNSCSSLTSVPALATTALNVSYSSIFNGCSSLARIQATNLRAPVSVANCKLSAAALNEIYTNLPSAGFTITVTGNYGTATDNPAIATAKGWTVTG